MYIHNVYLIGGCIITEVSGIQHDKNFKPRISSRITQTMKYICV